MWIIYLLTTLVEEGFLQTVLEANFVFLPLTITHFLISQTFNLHHLPPNSTQFHGRPSKIVLK